MIASELSPDCSFPLAIVEFFFSRFLRPNFCSAEGVGFGEVKLLASSSMSFFNLRPALEFSTTSAIFCRKKWRRITTTEVLTVTTFPMMIKTARTACWNAVKIFRFTVARPCQPSAPVGR